MEVLRPRKMLLAICIQIIVTTVVVVAVRVNEDTPLDTKIPAPGSKFCVALSSEEAVCSSEPMEARRVDLDVLDGIGHGVDQRIDGTDTEQNSIKEVLKLMNAYWNEEVLSNLAFASVRSSW